MGDIDAFLGSHCESCGEALNYCQCGVINNTFRNSFLDEFRKLSDFELDEIIETLDRRRQEQIDQANREHQAAVHSVKCPRCGRCGPLSGGNCKRCRREITAKRKAKLGIDWLDKP